jgi:two-component system phosphate regulon response regulator PhoB
MIFLVEDNEAIRETVVAYLQLAGHTVKEFPGVHGVLEALDFQKPELIIFDVMLPDGNGLVLAKSIHTRCPDLPFIFLTARESESDRITGFEIGADDYIIKPFSPRELSLRVQAILKRCAKDSPPDKDDGSSAAVWRLGSHELEIDDVAHRVERDGKALYLTLAEWKILSLLVRHGQRVTGREQILGEALDYLHDGSERAVNTHISNLRAKLGDELWIETVRGVGYRFMGEP